LQTTITNDVQAHNEMKHEEIDLDELKNFLDSGYANKNSETVATSLNGNRGTKLNPDSARTKDHDYLGGAKPSNNHMNVHNDEFDEDFF